MHKFKIGDLIEPNLDTVEGKDAASEGFVLGEVMNDETDGDHECCDVHILVSTAHESTGYFVVGQIEPWFKCRFKKLGT